MNKQKPGLTAKESKTGADAPEVEVGGRLQAQAVPVNTNNLSSVTLAEITGELLGRIRKDIFAQNEETISFGCQIVEELRKKLEVHNNRFSTKRYRDLFETYYTWVGPPRPRIGGATVVDMGCGSVNPFGLLFLFLMLGARRGIAVDLDEIQNMPRAVSAMAEIAGFMAIDPANIVREYPITGMQVLENISSFDLSRMRVGDSSGLDRDKIVYLQESATALSIGSSEVDLLVSNAFFEHCRDVEKVIAEMARITRPGGFGIHTIDGSDHRRYSGVECHPLAFLEEETEKLLVYGCNRIRPLQFREIFQQYGFDVIDFQSFQRIEVDPQIKDKMAEPFRSLDDETLSHIQGKYILKRQ